MLGKAAPLCQRDAYRFEVARPDIASVNLDARKGLRLRALDQKRPARPLAAERDAARERD